MLGSVGEACKDQISPIGWWNTWVFKPPVSSLSSTKWTWLLLNFNDCVPIKNLTISVSAVWADNALVYEIKSITNVNKKNG